MSTFVLLGVVGLRVVVGLGHVLVGIASVAVVVVIVVVWGGMAWVVTFVEVGWWLRCVFACRGRISIVLGFRMG